MLDTYVFDKMILFFVIVGKQYILLWFLFKFQHHLHSFCQLFIKSYYLKIISLNIFHWKTSLNINCIWLLSSRVP